MLIINFQHKFRHVIAFVSFLILVILSGTPGNSDYSAKDEIDNSVVKSYESQSLASIDFNIEEESDEKEKIIRLSVPLKIWINYFSIPTNYLHFHYDLPAKTHYVLTEIDLPPPFSC